MAEPLEPAPLKNDDESFNADQQVDAVLFLDIQGLVQSWSRDAERLFGYSAAEIVGRSVELFNTPEDIASGVVHRELREATDTGRRPAQQWHVRQDGSRFLAEGTLTPLYDAAGRSCGFAKLVRDLTPRGPIHARPDFPARLLDMVGQAVIATDPQGTILYWNCYAESLYGRRQAEVVGRNVMEVVVSQAETPLADEIMSGLRAGKSWSGEFLVQRQDGSIFPAQVTNTPVFDDAGILRAIVGISSDVSARKGVDHELAERAAEAEQQRRIYETVLSNTADFNYVFDLEGRFVYVNQALLTLWNKQLPEAVGKNFFELDYPTELAARLQRQIQTVIVTKQPLRDETPFTSERGERQYEYIFMPVIGADGVVEAVAGSTRDVTEERLLKNQLQRARARLEEALAVGAIATWLWEIPDDRVYADANLAEWFSISTDDAAGGPLTNYVRAIHPADRDRVEKTIAQAIAAGGNYEADYRIVNPDQSSRWVIARGRVERDAGLRPLRMAGVLVDITARKFAENARDESEAKFRLMADTIPQLAWMAHPDGHIFWYNRGWYDYTGTTPEQMEGWGWQSVHDPAVLPGVLDRWKGSIADGAPFEMIFPLKGSDGSFRPFLTRVNPLWDETGGVLYWFGTNTDISESKRAEDTARFLADASASLAAVVDCESTLGKVADVAVPFFADWCAVDLAEPDGALRRLTTVHTEPAKIQLATELRRRYPPQAADPFGPAHVLRTLKPELAPEITDDDLVASIHDQRQLALLRELGLKSYICVPILARGKAIGVITFLMSESGRRYGQADLLVAEDLAHRAAVAIDNSLLYAELQEADRRKDEFLATLAHELRNPLAPIRNALQILQLPRIDAATIERSRAIMERQVHQLVRLVDDLLDVSRVMRGKIELRRERIELATVVARAIETVQPLIEVQRHELVVAVASESLLLDADPVRLAQVVGNLLTNAAKYTEPGGRIELTARREGNSAILRIRDNGIGMTADILPHIFELFVQVDHTATRSQGGLGIGLTLVKNLVEMHSGTVAALSEGLGKGTEFVVSLPLETQPAPEEGRSDSTAGAFQQVRTGRRVLVVDDNRDAAVSLAMLLRLQGHEVQVAHSGATALELSVSYVPEAVFLDIGMPGMDGFEVARRLRQQPGLEHVVLAALTGWGQPEERRRTAEAGFDYHLVKPPEPQAVELVLAGLKRKNSF